MKKSAIFKLNFKDLFKGFLVAAITVIVAGLYTTISDGSFPDWAELKTLGLAGLAAGVSYLLKNFFTNSSDEFATKER